MKEKLEFKIIGLSAIILVISVIIINIIVNRIEKADIYSLSKDRLSAATKIITKSIELTMLEGKADVTKSLVSDLKSIAGFEHIEVFDMTGKEAFKHDGAITEAEAMRQLAASGEHKTLIKGNSIIYYMPLENLPSCRKCHAAEGQILGAVKVSISLEKEYAKIADFMLFMTVGSLLGLGILGFIFWQVLRGFVILPITKLETSAMKMAEGDLSFKTEITTNDEMGRLDRSIKESLESISRILRRVKEVSRRIAATADSVEEESATVVKGTQLESEEIAEMSSSLEQLNSAIAEISDGTENLARSVEETAASIEQMTSTISSLTKMTHEVSEGVDSTSSSIEELSATIKEVARSAGELEKVTDETLSAVDEIISSVKEIETSAKDAAMLSEKAKEDASTFGVSSINRTMEGMDNIRASFRKTADIVNKLAGRSEEIGNILIVIDEITDQTALLALNAAILAAQAGEHGKGFSVVANEIKDLAERTAFSTGEIDQLIKAVRKEVRDAVTAMSDGMSSVEEGSKLTKEASSALRMILDSATKSSEMSVSIERTTTEQAKAARYVSEAIEKVRFMVEQIAKATLEQSKGVSLIIDAAEKMRDASHQADKATGQQAIGSKQIAGAIEHISEMSQQISMAIREQKTGSNRIWSSLDKIKSLPERNRSLAFRINRELRSLVKDSELVNMEMERFKLYEARARGSVSLGVVPFETPSELVTKLSPLVSYLGRSIGKRLELRVASDYRTAIDEFKHGITQLCFMTSATYLEASKEPSIKPIAKLLRNGKPYHRSVIVVRDDSGIKSVKDLMERSFAFVDRYSVSGYILPLSVFQQEGISLNNLSFHDFLGYHDDVIEAVIKGGFDAGAVIEDTANKFKGLGIRIIWTSQEIPEFVICHGSMEEEDLSKTRAALLGLNERNPESALILGAINKEYTAFSEASDEDYGGIRSLISKVNLF